MTANQLGAAVDAGSVPNDHQVINYQVADYRLAGDLFKIIPELEARLLCFHVMVPVLKGKADLFGLGRQF